MKIFILVGCALFSNILLADTPQVAPIVYIPLELTVGVQDAPEVDLGDDAKEVFVGDEKSASLVVIDTQTGVKRKLDLSPMQHYPDAIRGVRKAHVSGRKQESSKR